MIAIYTRQSIDKRESESIENQIKECLALIRDEQYIVYTDKGFSGKNTQRPDLQRMIEDIKCKKINAVYVYRLDRISRNIADFYQLYQFMNDNGCSFVSARENFDTSTPAGILLMNILASFAQMERESIQMRVKDNYYFRIKDGRWAGGPAPYGFKNGKIDDKIPTLIKIDEEMVAVKLAFNHYEDDFAMSLGKVARLLESKGFESRKRRTFDNVTIARILQNPVYAIADETLYKYYKSRKAKIINPIEEWDGTRAAAIVGKKVANKNTRKYTDLSEQTVYLTNFSGTIPSIQFVKVQERLSQNQQIKRANAPTRMKELAGLLKCAKCEYAIKIYNNPKLDCYKNRGLHDCDAEFKSIDFEELRKSIRKKVIDTLSTLAERVEESERGRKKIEDELNKLIEKRDNMIEQSAGNPKLERAYANSIEKIQDQIEAKDVQLSTYTPIKYEAFDFNFIEMELGNEEKAKAIYRKLIKRILLEENGDYTIEWKI